MGERKKLPCDNCRWSPTCDIGMKLAAIEGGRCKAQWPQSIATAVEGIAQSMSAKVVSDEYQAYSDYLQTCEIMDVVPLPPAIREEGE